MSDDHQVPSFGHDPEELRRKLEELDRFMKRERAGIAVQRGKLVWFKPTCTRTVMRILPPWSAQLRWVVAEDQHSKLPGLSRPLPCGRSLKQSCVICDLLEQMRGRVPAETVKPFQPHRRNVFNCLVRGEEPKGVQAYGLSDRNMNKIWRWMANPTVGYITDPVKGRDVILIAMGDSSHRNYDVERDDAPSPLIPGDVANVKTNQVLSNLPDLDAHLAAMCRALAGTIEDAAKKIYELFTVTPMDTTTATTPAAAPKTIETLDVVDEVVEDAHDKRPVERRGWKELLRELHGKPGAYLKVLAVAEAAGVGPEEVAAESDVIALERLRANVP